MRSTRSHVACLLACLAAAALVAGCRPKTTGKSASPAGGAQGGGGGILGGVVRPGGEGARPFSLRVDSQNRLRQIGTVYLQATLLGDKVTGPEVLGPDVRLTDPSGQPYEVVWNVDPGKLGDRAPRLLLAWEKAPDKDGGRCVLMADCKTLGYLRADEFERAEKASPNR